MMITVVFGKTLVWLEIMIRVDNNFLLYGKNITKIPGYAATLYLCISIRDEIIKYKFYPSPIAIQSSLSHVHSS